MAKIKTKNNVIILVDREELDFLNQWTWFFNGQYAVRPQGARWIIMHREIVKAPHWIYVDHVNGNTKDNRKENLRLATPSQNRGNSKKVSTKTCTSKYKGVRFMKDRQKWQAAVQYRGIRYHLGCFTEEIDAAKAYDKKAKQLFGKFAKLNF